MPLLALSVSSLKDTSCLSASFGPKNYHEPCYDCGRTNSAHEKLTVEQAPALYAWRDNEKMVSTTFTISISIMSTIPVFDDWFTWVMFFFSYKSTVWNRSYLGTPSLSAPERKQAMFSICNNNARVTHTCHDPGIRFFFCFTCMNGILETLYFAWPGASLSINLEHSNNACVRARQDTDTLHV